jgi:hypothetical protein
MAKNLLILVALIAVPSVASAELFVMGNNETGAVVIRGNFPNGIEADEAGNGALAQRKTGWTQLLEDDTPGWGAVACVRTKDSVYFSVSNGHKSEGEAMKDAIGGAKLYIQKNGDGILVPNCAPRWNNQGQQIALDASQVPDWKDGSTDDSVMDYAKGAVRKAAGVNPDYDRDCAPAKTEQRDKQAATEKVDSKKAGALPSKCNHASSGVRG